MLPMVPALVVRCDLCSGSMLCTMVVGEEVIGLLTRRPVGGFSRTG